MESISQSVLSGVGQTFTVAFVGLLGRYLGVISEEALRHLTRLTIAILLPCFLFEAVLADFTWTHIGDYSVILAASLTLLTAGLVLAWVGSRLLGLNGRDRRTTMAMSGFNNSVNIPIPLALALLGPNDSRTLVLLFTLYTLLWNPILWSLGVWLVAPHEHGGRSRWRQVVNPPGVAVLVGILAETPGIRGVVDHPSLTVLHRALTWTGEAAIPMCLLILGGIIGGMIRRMTLRWRVVGLTALVKLIALPGLAAVALRLMPGIDPLVALAVMIQAASPPATNLAIIAEHWGGDVDTIGATLVVTYALSVGTFVLWLGLLG